MGLLTSFISTIEWGLAVMLRTLLIFFPSLKPIFFALLSPITPSKWLGIMKKKKKKNQQLTDKMFYTFIESINVNLGRIFSPLYLEILHNFLLNRIEGKRFSFSFTFNLVQLLKWQIFFCSLSLCTRAFKKLCTQRAHTTCYKILKL